MTGDVERSDDARYLILMRHAKSDWSDTALSDHDRPLNQRGRRDAPKMANWLADLDLIPDQVLCSSSARTRETVTRMIDCWTSKPQVSLSERLYEASPEDIFKVVRRRGGAADRLLVVGHNPGMTALVSQLAGKFTEMPTAAIAVFRVDCDSWPDLRSTTAMQLIEHMRPKALG